MNKKIMVMTIVSFCVVFGVYGREIIRIGEQPSKVKKINDRPILTGKGSHQEFNSYTGKETSTYELKEYNAEIAEDSVLGSSKKVRAYISIE